MPASPEIVRSLGEQITASIARLANERGISVEIVETRAGLPTGTLRPVDATQFDLDGMEAVCIALGIEDARLLFAN